ncbi:hypothetical protein LUX57_43420 [Actinomadura madurae]|uniref:hypothetical protein n=1 Tax=Actinomadura madurae TaxID=1993 RepID=UPI0020D205D4|nr:hypothetical protein [Actinomadura madurae]MCP9971148.1 hypothetical protein [Actinomadura madurae]
MHDVHVPQAAVGLLQVGFLQEGQLALGLPAVAAHRRQLGEPGGRVGAPVGEDGGAQLVHERVVPGDPAGRQQAERGLHVAARHGAGLVHGADGVVEPGPGVPDRVPDAVGEGGDAGQAAVQQDEVEVAAGGQLAAGVAADRHEGDAVRDGAAASRSASHRSSSAARAARALARAARAVSAVPVPPGRSGHGGPVSGRRAGEGHRGP